MSVLQFEARSASIYKVRCALLPSSGGFPRLPLDSFVLDDTGGVDQR